MNQPDGANGTIAHPEQKLVAEEREAQERRQAVQRETESDYKAPVQWEYQTFFVPPQDPVAAMNKLGVQGWEFMVQVGANPKQGLLWIAKRTKRLVQLASPDDARALRIRP